LEEHEDAVAWDYINGIGVLEGDGISSNEWRCGMIAISDLAARAREVLKNPSAFSEYTVEFANIMSRIRLPDEANEVPRSAETGTGS
jgi:hypothetical protein